MREQIAHQIPRRATAERQPVAQTDYDVDDDAYYPQRMPSSVRRYTTTQGHQVIQQGNRRIIIHNEPPPKPKRRTHWLLWIGIGMIIMLVGWVLLTMLGTWWINQQNTWSYGFPRTYQTDQVVGHADSTANPSHFIALNLNGHIEVIEFPGGDGTHAKIYLGPELFGDNASLTPVTLSFKDVNGDGKPDLLINVQGQTIVFLNDGTQFKSPKQ